VFLIGITSKYEGGQDVWSGISVDDQYVEGGMDKEAGLAYND
jgi:hypothetical protein